MQDILINKREIGKKGETLAKNYLRNLGYKIIDSNYFQRTGEIDIIATENRVIVFVEVKSLYNENFLQITDTISSLKKKRLIKTCKVWLLKNRNQDCEFRIDFFGLVFKDSKVKRIVHLKNAIF